MVCPLPRSLPRLSVRTVRRPARCVPGALSRSSFRGSGVAASDGCQSREGCQPRVLSGRQADARRDRQPSPEAWQPSPVRAGAVPHQVPGQRRRAPTLIPAKRRDVVRPAGNEIRLNPFATKRRNVVRCGHDCRASASLRHASLAEPTSCAKQHSHSCQNGPTLWAYPATVKPPNKRVRVAETSE